jgi:hypothetical protein
LSKEVRIETRKSSKKSLLGARNNSNHSRDNSRGMNTSRFSKNPLDRSVESEMIRPVFGAHKNSMPDNLLSNRSELNNGLKS